MSNLVNFYKKCSPLISKDILALFFVHRITLLILGYSQFSVWTALNFIIACLEDMKLYLLLILIKVISEKLVEKSNRLNKILSITGYALLIILFSLNIRFYEYYGRQLDIMALYQVKGVELFTGLQILATYPVTIFTILSLSILTLQKQYNPVSTPIYSHSLPFTLLLLTISGVGAQQFSVLISRQISQDSYFTINPINSILKSIKNSNSKAYARTKPKHNEIKSLKLAYLGNDLENSKYPFKQESLITSNSKNSQYFEYKKKIKLHLDTLQKKWGPPNIVYIIEEGLSADKIGFYNNSINNLTPNIDKILKENAFSFTNTYHSAQSTQCGQVVTQCGIDGVRSTPLMDLYPKSNLRCIQEFTKERGYETYFTYNADNSFNNQSSFYNKRLVDKIFDIHAFPKDAVTGGWGVSDYELIKLSLNKLKYAQQPFMVTILTLTNHAPYTLPNDAPDDIKNLKTNNHDKIIRYVDFVFAQFYKQLIKDFPNTIVVLVADHSLKTPKSDINRKDDFIKAARIPFSIIVPEIPKQLAGKKIPSLTSQMDVTPTVLSLLGQNRVSNHFMGIDAFIDRPHVFSYFKKVLYSIKFSPNYNATPQHNWQKNLEYITTNNLWIPTS